jgi:hypothetical protein
VFLATHRGAHTVLLLTQGHTGKLAIANATVGLGLLAAALAVRVYPAPEAILAGKLFGGHHFDSGLSLGSIPQPEVFLAHCPSVSHLQPMLRRSLQHHDIVVAEPDMEHAHFAVCGLPCTPFSVALARLQILED